LLLLDAILRRRRKVKETEAVQKTKNPGTERGQSLAKEADPANAPGPGSDLDQRAAGREAVKDLEAERGLDPGKGRTRDQGQDLAEDRDQETAEDDPEVVGPGAEAATAGETREIRRKGKDRRHRRRNLREVGCLRRQRRRAKRASTRVKSQRKTRNIKSDLKILKYTKL